MKMKVMNKMSDWLIVGNKYLNADNGSVGR